MSSHVWKKFFAMTSVGQERRPVRLNLQRIVRRPSNGSLNHVVSFGRLDDHRPLLFSYLEKSLPGLRLIYENVFTTNRPSGPRRIDSHLF